MDDFFGFAGIKKDSRVAIEVHDLTVSYGRRAVLYNVDFEIEEGQLVAVIGPNGAGKTTLLKTMAGMLKPLKGWVKIYGQPPHKRRGWIGYVPQKESVDWEFPATVLDVVMMGTYGHLGWFRRPGKRERDIAFEALREVGIENLADRHISELSGGQQQRTFIARALAQKARVYFMDEPFAGVDARSEEAILSVLDKLKHQGKTVVVVHHDLYTVSKFFDSVILLNLVLIDYGRTSEVMTEENLRRTYGGRIDLVSKIAEIVRSRDE